MNLGDGSTVRGRRLDANQFTAKSRGMATFVLIAALSVAVGACSSSAKSTSAQGTSSTSASAANVTAAEQAVTAAEKLPTSITVSQPLKSAPAKGKTAVFIECDIADCAAIANGFAAAGKAAGWNTKILQFQLANPASLVAAMNQALQYHPVAVGFSSEPVAVWQQEIPVYQKAGVALIPDTVGPLSLSATVPAAIAGPQDQANAMAMVASWVTATSNGTGHVLAVNIPQLSAVSGPVDSFLSDLTKDCSGCSSTTLNATLTEQAAGQTGGLVVSALRKDPSLQYVITGSGAIIDGLPSSLAAAGLTGKVKVGGYGGDVTNQAAILAGTEEAFTGFSYTYVGWMTMDAALRHEEGMTFPAGYGTTPQELLTKTSMTTNNITPSSSVNYPSGYAQQFETLWHVSAS